MFTGPVFIWEWEVVPKCVWMTQHPAAPAGDSRIGHVFRNEFPYEINKTEPGLIQWPFQDPKLEVPIPYIRPIFQAYVREYPHKIWPYMVQYLQFRILEFPLIDGRSKVDMTDMNVRKNKML
jgi:hypothetical protein